MLPPPGSEAFVAASEQRIATQRREKMQKRIRKARFWNHIRHHMHRVIDGAFYVVLMGYELPHHSRWILFAQTFWADCPVCFFWRGVTFGFLLASALATLVALVLC